MEQSGSVPGMLWSVFVSVSLLCFRHNENISETEIFLNLPFRVVDTQNVLRYDMADLFTGFFLFN